MLVSLGLHGLNVQGNKQIIVGKMCSVMAFEMHQKTYCYAHEISIKVSTANVFTVQESPHDVMYARIWKGG